MSAPSESIESGIYEPAEEIPTTAWLMRRLRGAGNQEVDSRSRTLGLFGLGLLFTLVGAVVPIETKIGELFFSQRPTFLVMMGLYQTVLFPTIIVFAFTIVVSLFRGGSLVKNLLTGLAITVPGWLALVGLTRVIHGPRLLNDVVYDAFVVAFAFYLGAAFLTTVFQIWTRWTLVSLNLSGDIIARTGITSLIELTTIYAVACAIGMWIDATGIVIGIVLFSALGLLAAAAIITCLIGFLSEPGSRIGQFLSILIASIASLVFCTVMSKLDTGWTISGRNLVRIAVTSLFGTLLITAVMGICLLWLRACGWRCVKRT